MAKNIKLSLSQALEGTGISVVGTPRSKGNVQIVDLQPRRGKKFSVQTEGGMVSSIDRSLIAAAVCRM
jgi:hypothetical protein